MGTTVETAEGDSERESGLNRKAPDPGEPCWELVNRTARRVCIERPGRVGVVLAPFAVLRATDATIQALELSTWLERGYVAKRRCATAGEGGLEPSTIAGMIVLLAASWLIAVWIKSSLPLYVGAAVVGLSAGPEVVRSARARKHKDLPRIRDEIWRACGMLAVTGTGFGLPVAAVFLQTQQELVELPNMPARSIAFLLLFALFVGSAATLPAMLFFLFAEQRRQVVIDQFHRDVLRLEPALRTIDEAEQSYSPLLRDILQVRRGPLFFAPIILSTFLLALGWVIAALPSAAGLKQAFRGPSPDNPALELCNLFVPNHTAFTFAFFGTYFFSINMVFRRYVRADLGPKAYSHIAVRIIVASILAWVASQTLEVPVGAAAGAQGASAQVGEQAVPWHVLLFAFFLGIVPETGLAVMHDLLKARWVSYLVPALRNRDPLTALEGITLYDQARLLEEGIENVENLANHNLVELLLRTRIPAPRLVDLVDQAILYLHARDESEDPKAEQPKTLARLKAQGIRTATDLEATAANQKSSGALGQIFAAEPGRIELILSSLSDDEWMPQVRTWRAFRETYGTVYHLDKMCGADAPGGDAPGGARTAA